jgi:hypothetical protein
MHRILIPLLLLSATCTQAQSSLQDKMADEFCVEFNKLKDLPATFDESAMQKISVAIIPVVARHKDEILKAFGNKLENQEDYQKIGELIGQVAVIRCPRFKEMMTTIVGETAQSKMKMLTTLQGTLTGVGSSGNFAYLKFKEADGKEIKIWWFEFFQGSENISSSIGKAVVITCEDSEVYDPTRKEYVTIKVANKLKIK